MTSRNGRLRPHFDGSITLHTEVSVRVPAGTSILEAEDQLMAAVNEAGAGLTGQLLSSLDADGRPLVSGEGRTLTAKRARKKRHVETPYGCVVVERWAYQSSKGGTCHYPLDGAASLIGAATPEFAQMLSRKMVELPAAEVVRDLRENHARAVTVDFVQRLTGLVGALAQSVIPVAGAGTLPGPEEVASVSIGVDGACLHMGMPAEAEAESPQATDGRKGRTREWRVGMVGAITLYDKTGDRLGTVYAATAPPEDKNQGKTAFWNTMEKEVAAVKARYPGAAYTGLSDGANDLLPWLKEHTTRQVLDFYHACGYLHDAAGAFAHEAPPGEAPSWWSHEACRHLKEDAGTVAALLAEMEERLASPRRLGTADRTALEKAITYFDNNVERMDYAACAA
ncbi:MAG: hypothetical protein EOP86_26440 [Verrucomicrobiaceae bacterium]|nr:MAG: hypothetical protein EOP86_26440 [Verrucomicrobiaceae bacterium]